jgi:hypothetical protein
MTNEPDRASLRFATLDEVEQSLAHGLRFNGRKQFTTSGEMMAKITAAHLVEFLRISGYVIMKRPPAAAHGWPPPDSSAGGDNWT